MLSDVDAEDPEVQEATKRLLSSKVLIPAGDDHDCEPVESSYDNGEFHDSQERLVEDALPVQYGSSSATSSPTSAQDAGEGAPPTETTSLLGQGSEHDSSESLRTENEEILRPSIFTSVGKGNSSS